MVASLWVNCALRLDVAKYAATAVAVHAIMIWGRIVVSIFSLLV
jgi:hypothetical protein